MKKKITAIFLCVALLAIAIVGASLALSLIHIYRGQAVSGPGAGLQPCSLSQPGDSAQRDLLRLPPRGYLPGDGEPVYDRAERLT